MGPAGGSPAGPIPQIAWRKALPLPAWVAEEVAFDENGDLREDLFTDVERQVLDGNRAANADGRCNRSMMTVSEDFVRNESFDQLVADSKVVVAGTIVGSGRGFYAGQPGTLYAVDAGTPLKKQGAVAGANILFLFRQDAEITTPHGLICAKDRHTPALAPGMRVIAFSRLDPIDSESRILQTDSDQQLFVERNGSLAPPPMARLSRAIPATYTQALARVRSLLAEAHGAQKQ
jgi:hypothetical protein